MSLVAWPLNESEAGVDPVLIESSGDSNQFPNDSPFIIYRWSAKAWILGFTCTFNSSLRAQQSSFMFILSLLDV